MNKCTPNNPCPKGIINAGCVVYTGPDIPCLGIKTNDRIDVAMAKIANVVCANTTTTTTSTTSTTSTSTSSTSTSTSTTTSSTTTTSTTGVAQFQAFGWWGDTDPTASLQAGNDTLSYQWNGSFNNNSPIVADLRGGGASVRYYVVKYPTSQSVKTVWSNTQFNNGTIPDQAWQSIFTVNGNRYLVSRGPIGLDPNSNTTIS